MRRTSTWSSVASTTIAALLVLIPNVTAKGCTTTQLTQLTGVAATYSSSPDCAGSALDTSTNTVTEICAGACMELVRQLQPDTPDCEYEGTNLGETMQELVAWCDAASISGSVSDPASTSALSSSAGSTGDASSTAIDTTDTVPVCTIANVTLIDDINTEAAKNADCLGSAGAATGATNKTAYCDEDACVAYLTDMEARLPNCTYGGYNIKQVVADTLALCDDPSIVWPNATTPTAAEVTTTTPAPTATTLTPTAAPSADSQATDTPAVISAAVSALRPCASFVAASALAFTVAFAWISL
ncbi:hypothetical protein PHYPSEUDO_000295 [Phytophthora pseudosyringae]|uniref:Elicitin n=1 Tax=Phytophthora pseudosyringae TaxID=221518 RepID=A0A8T1V6D3_9STRA|nr:hypothetical protein PHYPSEUDO_000295 [Phytophthora pseudosyringae]